MINIINPKTGNILLLNDEERFLLDTGSGEKFPVLENHVYKFLQDNDTFYEGSYLNNIKFIPRSEKWYDVIPLWGIGNGYIWEVRRQFEPGATLLELGCAAGVDYFGQRYDMIGLDLSFSSLKAIKNYKYKIQADALNLPLSDNSVDGIISSYFWEHIPADVKNKMLNEFKRVLKPGGKIVFLYDVETKNRLIDGIKKKNLNFYKKEFLDKDGHVGYETPEVNLKRFVRFGFRVVRHFGMERTVFQSSSVYEKMSRLGGIGGRFYSIFIWLMGFRIINLIHIFLLRAVDESIGQMFKTEKSRIVLTVAEKSK